MKYSYKEYAEVYEVIKADKVLKEKLPKEILEHIKSRAKKTRHVLKLDEKYEIFNQISRKALLLVTYLYLKYVKEDIIIREKLKEILVKNEMQKRV